MELFTKSAKLGCSKAHHILANFYYEGGDLKKAKYTMRPLRSTVDGHKVSRCNIGLLEAKSGNMERAVKHWTITASGDTFWKFGASCESLEHCSICWGV